MQDLDPDPRNAALGATESADAYPLVSIIVPCRNEARYVAGCLDSIIAGDYPLDHLEVLVADGMSDDGTREIVERYVRRHPFIRLIDSHRQTTPAGLNLGIATARGTVIVRMDAHAVFPPTYVSDLVAALESTGADGVGGVCRTLAGSETPIGRAIAAGLAHPFGVGNAYFRIGTSAPRWVDTVPFGCYRRDVFDRVGLFDEDLTRNQDDEFNLRLVKHGGRLLLVPHVVSRYFARASLRRLCQMSFQYGFFKPLVVRKLGRVMTVRQLIPALFCASLLISGALSPWVGTARLALAVILGSYLIADVICATGVGLRLGWRVGLAVTGVFPVLHLAYGMGFLRGVFRFLLLRRSAPTLALSR